MPPVPPPICPCCQQCIPCVCDPPGCVDLVFFGGSCPSCVPRGVRIPIGEAGVPPGTTHGGCLKRWESECNTRPTGMNSCNLSPPPYNLPACCCVKNPACTGPIPPATGCVDLQWGIFSPGYANDCDPQLVVYCYEASPPGTPLGGKYFLNLLWRCALGGQNGGIIRGITEAVTCDPFQVTWTVFTQQAIPLSGGSPGTCGPPCASDLFTSVIMVPHV